MWRPILTGEKAVEVLAVVREIALDFAARGEVGFPDLQAAASAALLLHEMGPEFAQPAEAALDAALAHAAASTSAPYLHGGVTMVGWLLDYMLEDADEDPNAELDQVLLEYLDRTPWPGPYDLISGLVGTGVYALRRRARTDARRCLALILAHLEASADRTPQGVAWYTPSALVPTVQREQNPDGYYNLGVAHGVPGIIGWLAAMWQADVERPRVGPLLEGAVAWLLAQASPDGARCFAATLSRDGTPSRGRTAWCYGDPGVAVVLLEAARVLGRDDWKREALRAAATVPRSDPTTLLVDDAGLCHGAAGLAQIYNRLHQATGDAGFLETARFWIDRALAMRRPGRGMGGYQSLVGQRWMDDASIVSGSAGIGLALLAAVRPVEPRWDQLLLLSLPT